jgi:hypothetical protein
MTPYERIWALELTLKGVVLHYRETHIFTVQNCNDVDVGLKFDVLAR